MLELLMEKLRDSASSDDEREMIECSITRICSYCPEGRVIASNYGKFCQTCWKEEWSVYFSGTKTTDEMLSDPFLSKLAHNNPMILPIEELRDIISSDIRLWVMESQDYNSLIGKTMNIVDRVITGRISDPHKDIIAKVHENLPWHLEFPKGIKDLGERIVLRIQNILHLMPLVQR